MKTIHTTVLLALAVAGCAGSAESDLEEDVAVVGAQAEAAPPVTIDSAESDPDTLSGEWTIEPVTSESPVSGVVTLSDVRAANHASFDRFVVAMEGGQFPDYSIGYAEEGVRQCGSGQPVTLEGEGMLVLRMEPVRAHDDLGNSTLDAREWALDLPAIREAEMICDFEAVTEIALGTAEVLRYRLSTLTNPHRIVVDIRH